MITGIGIDVVELERIEKIWDRYGLKFAQKILHEKELHLLPKAGPISFLAGRFAAKEALSKALGTGFSAQITFKDFCVLNLPSGQPVAHFYGAALSAMSRLGAKRIFLSITHSRTTAAAMAVLEA